MVLVVQAMILESRIPPASEILSLLGWSCTKHSEVVDPEQQRIQFIGNSQSGIHGSGNLMRSQEDRAVVQGGAEAVETSEKVRVGVKVNNRCVSIEEFAERAPFDRGARFDNAVLRHPVIVSVAQKLAGSDDFVVKVQQDFRSDVRRIIVHQNQDKVCFGFVQPNRLCQRRAL
jgi:hypothetical protein